MRFSTVSPAPAAAAFEFEVTTNPPVPFRRGYEPEPGAAVKAAGKSGLFVRRANLDISTEGAGGYSPATVNGAAMPTLIRFLVVLIVLAAIGGAAVVYLAYFVEPKQREMTVKVPPSKLGQ
jgi:hypothetical protein